MPQVQKHGFMIENAIRVNAFDLCEEENDTNTHDIPKENNKFDSNETISVKATVSNKIDCGDIIRFYDYDFNEKHTIMLITVKQVDGETKQITNIYEIDYSKELHNHLFGTISREELVDYVNSVKGIAAGKLTAEERDEKYKKQKKELQKKHQMKITVCPKVDSKNQRRVQCSINNFANLCKDFIKYDSVQTAGASNVVRGKQIPLDYKSKVRSFNKKRKTEDDRDETTMSLKDLKTAIKNHPKYTRGDLKGKKSDLEATLAKYEN